MRDLAVSIDIFILRQKAHWLAKRNFGDHVNREKLRKSREIERLLAAVTEAVFRINQF